MASGVELSALVLPKPAQSLPRQSSSPVVALAAANRIALIQLDTRSALSEPKMRATLGLIAPDLIVVACFPWRLPEWIVSLPRLGSLNIHPSLLPDGRGPEPVFWAFRWGLSRTGVTFHFMDAGWDTGPLVAQREMIIPEDATVVTLEQSLARLGAHLLTEHLPPALDQPLAARPQPVCAARYAPFPGADDLLVSTALTARDAARFIHAIAPRYGAIEVLVLATGQRLAVNRVVSMTEEMQVPVLQVNGTDLVHIAFASGTLVCQMVTVTSPLSLHVPQIR
ncbi:MAG TPA: formyltransferase family protein [Thermomicrobiales bacterium]|nr:formyltransferase family protein [Thermomicrobiales bacterium]